MVVLSLFDGCSCGRLALHNLGIPVDRYYAFEINKNAILVSRNNWKDVKQCGDVNFHKWHKLPKIDLLIGGSPCQGFSNSGKGENFEHKESKLFFKFVECLEYYKPKYFMLENVRMKKEWKNKITSYVGVEPVQLNSKDFSAQNRIREYWANFPIKQPIKKSNRVIYDILDNKNDWGKVHGTYTIYENKKTYITKAYLQQTKELMHDSDKICILGLSDFCISRFNDRNKINSVFHKSSVLIANADSACKIGLNDQFFRYLTLSEREKLQGLPVNYTNYAAPSCRNEMIGNGWNVPTIEHIFKIFK